MEIVKQKSECSKNYHSTIEEALQQASDSGKKIVASMPQLLAARTKAPKEHPIWHNWYTTTSEEDVGIDAEGRFGQKGKPVLIVVHGNGILTVDRIRQARKEGFINGAALLTDEEISNLLTGKINDLPLYHFDDFKITKKLPDYYGIVLDFELAKHYKSDYQKVHTLKNDALFIARTGGIEQASKYLDKAVEVYNTQNYGNWHLFNSINPLQPQGRLLFLGGDDGGLDGGTFSAAMAGLSG